MLIMHGNKLNSEMYVIIYIGSSGACGTMMHLCGDNWDKRLNGRYIRLGVKKEDFLRVC